MKTAPEGEGPRHGSGVAAAAVAMMILFDSARAAAEASVRTPPGWASILASSPATRACRSAFSGFSL